MSGFSEAQFPQLNGQHRVSTGFTWRRPRGAQPRLPTASLMALLCRLAARNDSAQRGVSRSRLLPSDREIAAAIGLSGEGGEFVVDQSFAALARLGLVRLATGGVEGAAWRAVRIDGATTLRTANAPREVVV